MTAVQLRPAPTQAAPALAARGGDVGAVEW
jgi:hypothetical protein